MSQTKTLTHKPVAVSTHTHSTEAVHTHTHTHSTEAVHTHSTEAAAAGNEPGRAVHDGNAA